MVTLLTGSRVVSVGVDWITATAKEVGACEQLLDIGHQALKTNEGCGYFSRRQSFRGYTGSGGEGCFVGTRADGVCLRVSGSIAHHRAADIARTPANITRLDVQVTVQFDTDRKDYAHEFVKAYRAVAKRADADTKRRSQLIDADSDGSTAALGSRSSAFFGRIYDKGREAREEYPIGTWRIESECKRELATPTFRRLAEHGFSRDGIISLMVSQWRKRGVLLDLETNADVDEPLVPRVRTDVERSLQWLGRVAQPVVRRLYDAGYGKEVTYALFGWLMAEGGEVSG